MKALIKREFIALVCSPVSIFFSIAFLLALGLMLWIFPGNFNILSAGYASLNPFFTLVSVLLIVLIPALTMRSFSEEKRTGNLDVYRSRPVSLSSLFFSKTLSVWLFFIFILATTAVYIYIIYVLSIPKGNLDINEIVSSYAGVMLLSLVFIIIGVFSSSLSKNQAVAYVLAVILNFLVFYGFDLLASVFDSIKVQSFISSIGISEHYRLMQKGVFQLKDIIVFVNYIIIFTVLGIYILSLKGAKDRKFLLYSAIAVIILNCIMIFIPNVRADFTEDRKYTMSDYSKKLLSDLSKHEEQIRILVYLEGDLNSGFQKLHNAVDDLLSDFERYSKNTINHKFVDPRHLADNSADLSNYMASMQMNGITLNEVGRDGKTSQSTIYPYAQIIRGEDTLSVKLLKNVAGYSSEENLNASVENLEFEFIDALRLLKNGDPVDIAFIEGHEEIERPYVYDAERLLSKYYFVNRGEIGNDVSVLKPFKVIIIAGPQKRFSETEKFVLDQYVMNGGRVLWLIDGVYLSHSDLEKLGQSPSMKNDVGLDDMLFTYGVRINPVLLQDKQCLPIYLTSGESDANNQYVQVPWYYSPLLLPSIDNPLTKDISLVKSVFASSIDFVGKNSDIKKDVLLTTSSNSHIVEVPEMIHFDTERALTTSNYFNQSFLPVGVTLEGKFNSLFENRLTPADIQMNGKQIKTASEHTKMIVVSSSSIIKNDLINYDGQTQALPMGFDRVTERQFGNPDFIVNAVNWLANDDDWFSLRNKHQKIRLLDRQKIYENGNQYSIIAVCVPVFFSLLVIGLCYYIRKRKYEKTI